MERQASFELTNEHESKGRYYRVEQVGSGVVLKPVKVPAHIIERRKKQEEKKKLERLVVKNREREARMNVRTILFYTLMLSAVAVVCFFYLHLQSVVTARADKITTLKTQLSSMINENDITQSKLESEINLFDVKKQASSELGMTQAAKDQIVYYSVQNKDYSLSYE